jgi:hypothetical protein
MHVSCRVTMWSQQGSERNPFDLQHEVLKSLIPWAIDDVHHQRVSQKWEHSVRDEVFFAKVGVHLFTFEKPKKRARRIGPLCKHLQNPENTI